MTEKQMRRLFADAQADMAAGRWAAAVAKLERLAVEERGGSPPRLGVGPPGAAPTPPRRPPSTGGLALRRDPMIRSPVARPTSESTAPRGDIFVAGAFLLVLAVVIGLVIARVF